MSQTDYAADLLGGKERQQTDYASDLVGPVDPQLKKSINLRANEFKQSAEFGTLTKASMVDDPQTKLRIFAKARFPKLAEKDAISRYAIVDGKVYYVDDDGQVGEETASSIKNFGANLLADAPSIAGGLIGSVAGVAGGPPGIVGGGAMGAAAGKGYGKVAANLAFDEPQTVGQNAKDMLTAYMFEAGGNLVGLGFAKALVSGQARDIKKLDPTKVAEIERKAKQIGVDLNVAQKTNLPSTKAKYDVLASMPTSRDIIAEDAIKQAKQANDAAESFISKRVSLVADVDEAGTQARDAAKKVIAKLTKERSAAAAPLYKQAFDEFQGIPEAMIPQATELMDRPSMKQAGRMAARIAKDEGIDLGDPTQSLKGMHYMKLALDKMIGDETKGGFNRTSRGALVGLKRELTDIMDQLSPTYAKARETFSHFTPNIISVEDGVISKVAGLKDEQAMEAAKTVFSDGRSPAAVERMRNLFIASGLEDDWNAMLASHLRETFSQAGREFATTGGPVNQAPKWRSMLVGNPRQYRLMEKAMSRQQFGAFNDMMEVFEAMGRTSGAGAGSQTLPRQEGVRLLREEAGSGVAGQTAQLLSPQNFGARAGSWLAEVRLGNHAERLAEIMTSQDGIKRLKELRRLSPNDRRFIAGASSLFGISLKPANTPADAPATEQEGQYQ